MLNPLQSTVLVILLFVSGCADPSIDKDFVHFINLFESHCKVEVTLPMIFTDLPGNVIGRCVFNKEVQIDLDFWTAVNDDMREVLVFHELGHCTLNQGHRKNSIMQNPLLSSIKYSQNREAYIDELCFFKE